MNKENIMHTTITVPANYTDVNIHSGYNMYLTSIVSNSSTLLGHVANAKISTDRKSITADLWYYDTASATRYTADITVTL